MLSMPSGESAYPNVLDRKTVRVMRAVNVIGQEHAPATASGAKR